MKRKQSQSRTRDNEVRQQPLPLVLSLHIVLKILIIFRNQVKFLNMHQFFPIYVSCSLGDLGLFPYQFHTMIRMFDNNHCCLFCQSTLVILIIFLSEARYVFFLNTVPTLIKCEVTSMLYVFLLHVELEL